MSLLEHINDQGKIISIETILRSSGIKYILESPRLIMVWSEDRIQLVSFLSRKSNCLLIGWFDEDRVKSILGIPGAKRVELIITLGYAAGEYRQKKRKPKDETVAYNKY